jgi:hypothetical protein
LSWRLGAQNNKLAQAANGGQKVIVSLHLISYLASLARLPTLQETDDEEEGGWQDGEGDPCPSCGRYYSRHEFWIACDTCDLWYCGTCANMNAQKAKKIPNWTCANCQH